MDHFLAAVAALAALIQVYLGLAVLVAGDGFSLKFSIDRG